MLTLSWLERSASLYLYPGVPQWRRVAVKIKKTIFSSVSEDSTDILKIPLANSTRKRQNEVLLKK